MLIVSGNIFSLAICRWEGGSISILFNWIDGAVLYQDVISGYLSFPRKCEVEKVTLPVDVATPHIEIVHLSACTRGLSTDIFQWSRVSPYTKIILCDGRQDYDH